jgi:hypothetical protein
VEVNGPGNVRFPNTEKVSILLGCRRSSLGLTVDMDLAWRIPCDNQLDGDEQSDEYTCDGGGDMEACHFCSVAGLLRLDMGIEISVQYNSNDNELDVELRRLELLSCTELTATPSL